MASTIRTFVSKVMSLLFNMLSRLVIIFLPRRKCLLISWLHSPSAVILEPPKIKSVTVSPSIWASLVAQKVKCLLAMQETQVGSLSGKDTLEKEVATHSSILAWRIPWTEEPGRLQSMGSQWVRHNWATSLCHEVMGPDAMILVFCMFSFKPTFSVSSFTFIKRIFCYSSLSAIRVVFSAYLRLLIFLLAILIPVCASSSPAFLMM